MPLAVIVIAFFMPTIRVCDDVESALSLALQGAVQLAWIAPPYIAAGLLVVAIVGAYESVPRGGATATGFVAVGLSFVSCAMTFIVSLDGARHVQPQTTLLWTWIAVAVARAVVSLRKARASAGWARMAALVAAYAALASTHCFFFIDALARNNPPDTEPPIGIGATLYLVSMLVLLPWTAWATRARATRERPLKVRG
jgi:hypothetical protein